MSERGSWRADLESEWIAFLRAKGFRPMTFVTLTFDPKRWPAISPGQAVQLFKWLVHELGYMAGGRHYKRRWKHAPFSYVVGVDYHKSGDVHLHAVIDGWIPYMAMRGMWEGRCGFCDIDMIQSKADELRALDHITRYLMKADSAPQFWLSRNPVREDWAVLERSGLRAMGAARPGGACQADLRPEHFPDRSQGPLEWQERRDLA